MTRAATPYRTDGHLAGPLDQARWESACGWSERWGPDRFVAEMNLAHIAVVGAAAVAFIPGILVVVFPPFGNDSDSIVFGCAVFAAVFVAMLGYTWGARRTTIEVTPQTTRCTLRTATASPTRDVHDVEARRPERDSNGDLSNSWTVQYRCGDEVIVVPVWTPSEDVAKMRAERLRAVIERFQSVEPSNHSKPGS